MSHGPVNSQQRRHCFKVSTRDVDQLVHIRSREVEARLVVVSYALWVKARVEDAEGQGEAVKCVNLVVAVVAKDFEQ